ncbi:MAG: ATP synthase F1 subunit epsilon [Cyanobacteriota bacterium]|nr:ATP synthase F1 subunit epsilon [Cyanobacteriota bacterium]MDY6359260.1 ATP synthase F1 subunit epsilon [Cyanobacteriota bacterium]MDY6364545.1 ATP synthase F1 subunit epsilon [Cyanobacteriota bacterium]MDY6383482.1 ATP synthase F1 subunit epsilon [Cyanobacteriota bacterium]
MNLKIITQEKVVFDSDVDEIYTKGVDGEFGILKGHIPVMSALDIGVTRIKKGDVSRAFTTMGGVLQFKDDECLILTTLAEPGDEIDEMRARESLERNRKLLMNSKSKMEAKKFEASVARAKARLKAKLNDE